MTGGPGSQGEQTGTAPGALLQLALPLLLLLHLFPVLKGVHLVIVLPHTQRLSGLHISTTLLLCQHRSLW